MPPNYQNGKIYKIYSYENDDVYYGSTIETLSARMTKHRASLKKYKEEKGNYVTSFKILELTSAKIELVENYPCNSREELLKQEGYYIRNNNCVNKIIPDRKKKEYYHQNKEHIKEQQKGYYEQNKEERKEQNKEYRKQKKEQIKEQRKEYDKNYYQQNIEQIKEYNKEYYQRKKEQALMLKEDIKV
jgi:hypothetical protein